MTGFAASGLGHAVAGESGEGKVDPLPFLKAKKSRKFMGVQDDLAVVAVGRALASAGLGPGDLGERAGLYLAVGYIPFEEADAGPVLAGSIDDEGEFSMARFASDGVYRAHPLLTFRCLPNMPAYHVSSCFDVQGPYVVGYPGAGQLYLALDEALSALERGEVERALVVGVAHQRNFLVEQHFARLDPPVAAERLIDAAGCLVIERAEAMRSRGAAARARLCNLRLGYEPGASLLALDERFDGGLAPPGEAGAASLPLFLSRSAEAGARGPLAHRVRSRDGVRGQSGWVVP